MKAFTDALSSADLDGGEFVPTQPESHYITALTERNGRLLRSACGAWVESSEHSALPTCATCARYLRADVETARQLEAERTASEPKTIARSEDPAFCSFARDHQHFAKRGKDDVVRCLSCGAQKIDGAWVAVHVVARAAGGSR